MSGSLASSRSNEILRRATPNVAEPGNLTTRPSSVQYSKNHGSSDRVWWAPSIPGQPVTIRYSTSTGPASFSGIGSATGLVMPRPCTT
jgi:hypothetical protein